MKTKKTLFLILIVVLLVTLVAGCSKADKKEKKACVAMGRYVEKSIDLPEAVQTGEENAFLFINNSEGQLELYTFPRKPTKGESKIQYTLNQDNNWIRNAPKWLNVDGLALYDLTYAPDGTKYALVAFQSKNNKFKVKILKSTDNQTSEEIIIDDFKTEVKFKKCPISISVLEDNSILLGYYGYCSVYKDGKETVSFKIGDNSYALSANRLMSINENLNDGIIIDVNSGKAISSVAIDLSSSYSFCSDKKGNWYVINAKGLHRMAKDGSTWETLIDGSICSMGKPSLYIDDIVLGRDEDFFVKYSDSLGKGIIKHYIFNKDIPTYATNTLTILSLKECPTIRQAIIDFGLEHTDVQVEYRVLMNDKDGTTATDHIKTINAELLSKKGSDILVVDGMPFQTYISKGVLTDLSDIVKPMLEKGFVLPHIINNYRTEDDKFFTVPLRITIPLAYGNKEAVNSTCSINSLADYAKKSNIPLFGPKTYSYSDLITILFKLYSNSFLKAEGFDRNGLINFLTQLKVICTQTVPAKEQPKALPESTFFSMSPILINAKLALLGIGDISHMHQVYEPIAISDRIKGTYTSINKEFTPYEMVSINNSSSNKELAKEFLSSLLGESVQSVAVGDGFPVNLNALNDFGMAEDDYVICYDDLEFTQPSNETMQRIIDLFKNATTPAYLDEELLSMVKEEAESFLTDKTDVESTADKIIAKTKAYLTE